MLLADCARIVELAPPGARPHFYLEDGRWIGWALASGHDMRRLPAEFAACGDHFAASGCDPVHCEPIPLVTDSDLIAAQRRVFSGAHARLLLSGREVEPGVFVARNVEIHPTARLVAPVHVAENCRVGRGATLGPNAAIGSGSVIDQNTKISNSIVCSGTYLGRGLQIEGSLVGPRRIVRARDGVVVEPDDVTILGEVAGAWDFHAVRGLINRALAVAAMAALAPIAAISRMVRRTDSEPEAELVATPAHSDPRRWRTFRLRGIDPKSRRIWDGLNAIARGRMRWFGNAPRTAAELLAMDLESRNDALSRPPGLFTGQRG